MSREMDMPTRCTCGRIIELNDMNTCDDCRELFCSDCLDQSWGVCENCSSKYTCEYEITSGKNKGLECGRFAPGKIEDMRVCNQHYQIIEKRLGL